MHPIRSAILASASLFALSAAPAFAQAAPVNTAPQKEQENQQLPPNAQPTNASGQPQCRPNETVRIGPNGQSVCAAQQDIVVTGSRIRRDNFNAPQNVDIYTRADTVLAGTRSTAETLQQATITSGTAQINGSFLGFVSENGAAADTIGLRGLGSQRTLVLLNGRRLAPAGVGNQLVAADLNVLPTAVVQRIEVLREGASSIYGSDAIAGVINIITDTSVDGLTLDGYADAPLAGGGETIRGSATWGKKFSRGHVLLSAEYREFAGLRANQRSGYSCPRDLFYRNGQEVGQLDPATGQLRCFPFAADQLGIASGYGLTYGFAPAFAFLGRTTFPGYTTSNPTIGAPVVVNNINLRPSPAPEQLESHILSPIKTITGYANASYDIDALGNASLYGEALFTRRKSHQDYAYQLNFSESQLGYGAQLYGGYCAFGAAFCGSAGESLADIGFPVSPFFPVSWANAGANYFAPFIVPDRLSHDDQTVNFFRGNAGLRGSLPFGDWQYDANYQVSRTRAQEAVLNPTITGLVNAMQAVQAPSGTPSQYITVGLPGQTGAGIGYTCASNVTNGTYNGGTCAPLDVFDPQILLHGHIPAAVYNSIWQENIDRTKFDQDTAEIDLNGSLFNLPGGPLKAAIGALHRHDHIKDTPSTAALNGDLYNRASAGITQGSDTVEEVYGELDAPILKDRPFFHLLEVDPSVRYTHYKSYGSDTTYHINAQWAPAAVLRFRGNYGTNFRAPNLYEQFVADQTGFYPGSFDPCNGFGTQYAPTSTRYKNCLAALTPILGAGAVNYVDNGSILVTTRGGRGNLKAEHAKTWGFGGIFTAPRRIADFSLAVDYWDVTVKGEVQVLNNVLLDQCYDAADFPNNPYCQFIGPRAPVTDPFPGNITSFLNPYLNVARQQASGLDFDARYATNLFGGHFQTQLQATRNLHQRQQLFAGDTNYDWNGTLGYPGFGAGPKWVGSLDTRFTTNNHITFRWGVKYVGKQSSLKVVEGNGDLTNGQVAVGNGIGLVDFNLTAKAYWEHGISVQWEWPNQGQVTLGVNNLFNAKPPTISGFPSSDGQYFRLGNYFGGGSYDYLGRSVFVNVTRKF
jgi:outer membrane receptor protein involved in Fe transport